MFGLYPVVDTAMLDERGIDVLAFVRAVLASKPAALQLRCKTFDAARVLKLSREISAMSGVVPFFVNDRPDLAILSGATGVHVGQDDLPPGEVVRLASMLGVKLRIGRSTHVEGDMVKSRDEPIDYVAIGPIFATQTKRDHAPVVGLERLARLAERSRQSHPTRPIVAIGGITEENIGSVAPHVDAVAVVSAAIDPSGDVAACVRRIARLSEALTRGRPDPRIEATA